MWKDSAAFQKHVVKVFSTLKSLPFGQGVIHGPDEERPRISLVPFTAECAEDDAHIATLACWRRQNQHGFPRIFTITEEGTRLWARKLLIDRSDRILFYVRTADGQDIGHVGLSSFDFDLRSCEIDNIVRGGTGVAPGAMVAAVRLLIKWTSENIAPGSLELRVLHDNIEALALYHRIGFQPIALIPLKKVEKQDVVEWVEADPGDHIDRFFLRMRHGKPPDR